MHTHSKCARRQLAVLNFNKCKNNRAIVLTILFLLLFICTLVVVVVVEIRTKITFRPFFNIFQIHTHTVTWSGEYPPMRWVIKLNSCQLDKCLLCYRLMRYLRWYRLICVCLIFSVEVFFSFVLSPYLSLCDMFQFRRYKIGFIKRH